MDDLQTEYRNHRKECGLTAPTGSCARFAGALRASVVTAALCVAATTFAQEPIYAQHTPTGCTGLTHTGEEHAETLPRRAHPRVLVVEAGSPAEVAKLRPDDVLVAVNGTDTRELESLFDGPTRTVHRVLVRRGEQDLEINLTMGASMVPVRLDGTVAIPACRSFGPGGDS